VEGSCGRGRGVDGHGRTELPRPSTSAEGTSEELGEFAVTVLFSSPVQLRAFLLRLLDGVRMRFRILCMGRGMSDLESRRVAWSHRANDVLAG
jgi:hypothetical protein